MEYKEFLFTESGKRHFTLSDDSISLTGKGLNLTLLLQDLEPEYRTVRQRTGGYYGGLLVFILGLIGAAVFAILRNTETEFYFAVGLAICGLLASFATFRKVEHAIFKNKTGIDAISIARAGPASSSFDLFVDELSRRIRQAKDRERIRPTSSCEIPARARGAAMKRWRLLSICLPLLGIVVTVGGLFWPKFFSPIIGLKDKDPTVRQRAVESLAESWVPKPVTLLTGALKDADAKVREAAAKALGGIGDKAAFEPLIGTLQDEDVRVRRAAALALPHVLPAVEDPETRARAVEPLIRALNDRVLNDRDSELCGAAAFALGEIGEAAVEPLIRAMKDADRELSPYVHFALGKIGKAAFERLIAALQDEDARLREAAAKALGAIGGKAALKPLIGALQHEDARLREAAAKALGAIGGKAAFEPLIGALQHEDARVRNAAELGMQTILPAVEDPETRARAVEPLIRAMKDDSVKGFSSSAPAALAMIGEPALEPLLRIMQDTQERARTRAFAAFALGNILGTGKDPLFLQSTSITTTFFSLTPDRVPEHLPVLGMSGVTAMRGFLSGKKGDAQMRGRAIELLTALQDDSPHVRAHAVFGLGQILSAHNLKNRKMIVPDPAIRQTAASHLTEAMQDDSQPVRALAAEALKKIQSEGPGSKREP